MDSPARRPTFFLSSTIFDFADLRSAIKFHLEQRGCAVLASEFNDFRKPLDTHSYDACLASIEQADYFVLMIGSRVGGWFDAKARVSITQQEYRTAYGLHQAGRLRIITLVRQDVWNFRESQKALARHLQDLELEPDAAATIARFPNKFAEDAGFIMGFIEEVGRNQQTKAALATDTALPTGNWIHVINSFRDVADVLNSVLLAGLPVEEIAFRRALRHELLEVLRACLLKAGDEVLGPRRHVEHFRKKLTIENPDPNSRVRVRTEDWDSFARAMAGMMGRRLHVALLPRRSHPRRSWRSIRRQAPLLRRRCSTRCTSSAKRFTKPTSTSPTARLARSSGTSRTGRVGRNRTRSTCRSWMSSHWCRWR